MSRTMHKYCTIVSSNYLPQALALAESFEEVYPVAQLEVLVIDLKKGSIQNIRNINFLYLEDMDLSEEIVRRMATYYDVVEFATAMKPSLLLHLLRGGAETASYIDPDVYLYDQIHHAQEVASRLGIALTPHRISPMPFVPSSPMELSFMRVGIYNLGFICVGDKSLQVLQWWEARLRWHATQFDQLPFFTDQKWADFFPTFSCCEILRHPGYNVAFWNIDERNIHEQQGKYVIDNHNLTFIHFSQMSTELMKRQKTDLWGSWLSSENYDGDTIRIVTAESKEYGRKLLQFKFETEALQLTPNLVYSSLGKFTRLKLIKRDIAGMKIKSIKQSIYSKTWLRIVNVTEKSSALTGFLLGLKKDVEKIQIRMKHKPN
jgi:hypothetical protein